MTRGAGFEGALERDELRLEYLPIVGLASGEVEGVEALLRWDRGTGAVQLPGSFLAAAERSGAMVGVGRWVLETAVADIGALPRPAGADPLRLSVNLSYPELVDGGLAGAVQDALSRTGYPAGRVCLEISEATLARDARAVAALGQLRELGLQLAVDDFGTGTSSLSLLQSLPVDELKIDRSFVARMHEDPTSAAIARSVVYLARSLELRTTAEGVELEAQERMLVGLRCTSAQGWLYARPLPSVTAAVATVDSDAIRRRNYDGTAALWSGLGSPAVATRLVEDAFERAPIGMALIDGTGTHLAVNPALGHLLGCPQADLVGRSCWDAVHPEDLALDQSRLDAVLRGELPGYALDERYVDTKGQSVWVEVTVGGVPEPSSERGPVRLLRQIRCIEDRLQAEQRQAEVERLNVRLSEQADVLTEANVRLAGFASSLSHDLQQPLVALGGYLDLLVEHRTGHLDADGALWLAAADRSARVLRDAVAALRATAQGTPVAMVPVDLMAVFHEALIELASELDDAGAEVEIVSLPVVQGDHAMLGRVAANLLGNACRYRDDARPLRISIEALPLAEDRAIVVVADNGRGFAPDELESVFMPRRRGSAAFDRAGTGTGLAIVRSIVNNLGGEVWAETADPGARVCIALRCGSK